MKRGLAILLAAITWLNVGAQSKAPPYFQLSGRVTDTAGMALGKATVQLTAGQDTLTTLSGDDGSFFISAVRSAKFLVRITMKQKKHERRSSKRRGEGHKDTKT